MKKISFVCVFVFVILFFFSCSSVNQENRKTNFVDNQEIELSLFSYDGKGESKFGVMNLGHCFLSLKNNTENEVQVGKYLVQKNEEISFGTWAIKSHFGLWYNVEANYVEFSNKYDGRVSISTNISVDKMNKMNEFILDWDKWSPINNCSKFAVNLWNKVVLGTEKIKTGWIVNPEQIAKEIKKFQNYETNRIMEVNRDAFYFEKNKIISYSFQNR